MYHNQLPGLRHPYLFQQELLPLPRLQQQLPIQQQQQQQRGVEGGRHDAVVEDLNWGSEDEDDLTGAMGGLNL